MKIRIRFKLAILLLAATATFAAVAHAEENPAGDAARAKLHALTLQQVYAMPMNEVEKLVGDMVLPECMYGDTPDLIHTCAINAYSASSRFIEVNSGLWKTDASGQALAGDEWAYVRVLDAALKELKPVKTTTYRGTNGDVMKLPQVGKIMRLKGYTSTSPDLTVAKGFLSGQNDMLMVIKTLSARDISSMAGAPEKELLLPRSSWVRFDKAEVKTIDVFNEELGREESRKVQFVYLTEVLAP